MDPQQLADLFSGLAQDVEKFRDAHQPDLSADDFATLGDESSSLLHRSNQFIGQAIADTLANAQVAAKQLDVVTLKARVAVKTINNAMTVIKIASAGVTLGTAILSGNVGQIISAADSLTTAITGGGAASAATGSPKSSE